MPYVLFVRFLSPRSAAHASAPLARSVSGHLCPSVSDPRRSRDAPRGSHGCPWECGLQLLHLRGAESVPVKGRGGWGAEYREDKTAAAVLCLLYGLLSGDLWLDGRRSDAEAM